MSVGGIGGSGPLDAGGYNPQYLEFLKEQYQSLFNKFLTSSTPANAQALLDFIQANEGALTVVANQVGYQPSPHETWASDLNGAITALSYFISSGGEEGLSQACEFTNDMRLWMGIGQSPEDIRNAVQAMIEAFLSNPNEHSALGLQWILSTPGYREALSVFASFNLGNDQFNSACMNASLLLNNYLNNPNDPNVLKALDVSLEAVSKYIS